MQLTFLGATDTVTGSRYLITTKSHRVLIDCGLFQGYKQLRLRNWEAPPFDPGSIDAVILTHAHIDHTGYVPRLVNQGFRGPVYCSAPTLALSKVLLPDSGFLQEEQARFANRHQFSKHSPALPLYTEEEAEMALRHFRAQPVHEPFAPCPGVEVTFTRAGHLLGASSVRLVAEGARVTFSGDLGRTHDPIMKPPEAPLESDYVVIESTYGDRLHPQEPLEDELVAALKPTLTRRGVAVVPAFAVGRAQTLLLLLARAQARGALPDVAVYLDSPMAVDATALYLQFCTEHRLSEAECLAMAKAATLVRTVEESKTIDREPGPMIIISASGMATGGRVLHHLRRFAPDPRNLILLAGFQAAGTRGAALAAGARELRMFGETVPVRAEVRQLASASSHADADELLAWLRHLPTVPRQVFITHGEPGASDALRQRIERELRWRARVPSYRDTYDLN
jgi:metallo-beta-lactamase family protein